MTQKKILITAALLYANGTVHFGHLAGAYLPADCYARFQRLLHNDVLFISGSDEYGIAITLSAELAKKEPKDHVDFYHTINEQLFKKLNFSFDHYSRTTWPGHVAPTQQFFLDLLQNGYIEARMSEQLYSEKDGKFLADRYVSGQCPRCGELEARGDECPSCGASYEATDLINPRSKLTQAPLILRKTKHWYLLLDKLRQPLMEWMAKKNWKPNVVNFVKGYIEELRPRAITRDSVWGIPIPLPESEGIAGKVLYVWFDAPIGYISATKEWAEKKSEGELWKKYWLDPATTLVQFIGKDNIPFHSVIFPAMIMGQNQPYKLVDELPANEFLKLEGRQFSKSDGWFIDLEQFCEKYSADQIRYTLAANAPETSDAEFTWRDFLLRCNGELLGKYGNLVNRVLVFAERNCGAVVPAVDQNDFEAADKTFLEQAKTLVSQANDHFSAFRLRKAAQTVMELAQLGNGYFDSKAPWRDAKSEEYKNRMNTTIYCCLEGIKLLALISWPIIPATAGKIWRLLGFNEDLCHVGWQAIASSALPAGQKLLPPAILFQKLEEEQIKEEEAQLYARAKEKEKKGMNLPNLQKSEGSAELAQQAAKPEVGIEAFDLLDLRVATILTAEPIPKSNKLYKLEVDLGYEKRVVVSGIREAYSSEELIGKKVVVIANLAPTTIRGVTSFGMLLAAGGKDKLELVTVGNIENGSCVS